MSTITIYDGITLNNSGKFSYQQQIEATIRINQSVNWGGYGASSVQSDSLFAVTDDKIIGYVSCFGTYIAFMAVEADSQRLGAGKKLLERVFVDAKEKNRPTVTLDFRGEVKETGIKNTKLINFYTNVALPYILEMEGCGNYGNKNGVTELRYSIEYKIKP